MIALKSKSDCCGCSACFQICPKHCIAMQADEQGFQYPIVDQSICVNCHLCEKVCPEISTPAYDAIVGTLATTNPDPEELESSSSGGIFSMLAKSVIHGGGVVFGAAFEEDWNISHIAVDSLEGIVRLRGSKYLQSKIASAYLQVERILEGGGRRVLFAGTPCQIAGLSTFLGKQYDTLVKVAIACHGVPSPLIWQEWLDYIGVATREELAFVNFRYKRPSWDDYSFRLIKKDGTERVIDSRHNLYMRGFIDGFYSRPSCAACPFKRNSSADLTIADFWGVKQVDTSVYNPKGVSLVILHSQTGKECIEDTGATCKEVSYHEAVKYNKALTEPSAIHPLSEKFWASVPGLRFSNLGKYYNPSILRKAVVRLKNLFL